MFRIGFGYDAHRLVKGRTLIIGGVNIPCELGLEGHSDADVLIHSLMDAILGALGRGDIGMHFPDSDPAYKGIDSTLLLKRIMDLASQDGYIINNTDNTIVAQRPRLAPHMQNMRDRLSQVLETPPDRINIKATTTEGMGFCGRGEGIAAYSIVSLVKKDAK
jgi:2-C-methyl-D-erythritol 2,4-cyclodiphosphate synthase